MPAESSRDVNSPAKSAQPFLYAQAREESASLGNSATAQFREVTKADADSANAPAVAQRAFEKGQAEGEARARVAFEKALAEARSQISVALKQFTSQRESYFERVEFEVVHLALSIAKKILHRESQIDPLLLAGVVRVALEGLNRETHSRLRANPDEIRFWRDYFTQATDIKPTPDLMGDPQLALGHCVLETELGTTHISFETQLKEIEQGFLDLLEHRPRVRE
jgi:flagellar assembly protein FliH